MKKITILTLVACLFTVSTIAIARYTGKPNLSTCVAEENISLDSRQAEKVHNTQSTQGGAQKAILSSTSMSNSKRSSTHATSNASEPVKTMVATAIQPSGIIGTPEGRVSDNPEDNVFEIPLGKINPNARAWLAYDLKGVSSASGISKSINDRPATGGYLTTLAKDWQSVREEISTEWLKEGKNTILFTLPSDASYSYSVRNVRIETAPISQESTGQSNDVVVFSQAPVSYGSLAYIHGFIRGEAQDIIVSGQKIAVRDGEFEGIVPVSTDNLSLTASVSGKSVNRTLSVMRNAKADFIRPFVSAGKAVGKQFLAHQADSLVMAGNMLSVDKDEISKTGKYTITALRETDLPALDYGMTNVTARDEGYRFLPHGEHFTGKGATVKIKYDRTKIPSGFTEDDINTYYFDKETKHWVALERVQVDKVSACVVSKTTHFTDMINGVIKAPESPQTDGFTPTMMNDIKAADPTAKINLITPPTANNRGSASLQYSFEMPPARNGMVPSLGIQYSSEGGSGWLGEGWDLPVPSITLDTRWGVPRYDSAKETETYLISGSMLSTMDEDGTMGVAHRGEKMDRKVDRQFYTRQGGDFSRIIRKGDSPANYYWEVTDKQGVKYTYGGEDAVLKGIITDAAGKTREVISEWKLKRIEETHGDYIEYVYETVDEPVRGGLVAKAIYLKEVHAGNIGQKPHTKVFFEGSKEKRLKSNNARYGFLTSSNRLLEKVTVNFPDSVLRSYVFSYGNGAFFKDVLTGVRQLDDKGQEVSYQDFAYYDDVQSDKGYVLFKDKSEIWNMHEDNLSAGFVNPLFNEISDFGDRATAIGGTLDKSRNISSYLGVGVPDFIPGSKSSTGGASLTISSQDAYGLVSFTDLDGDGLPDKVFREEDGVYYRPQLPSEGVGTAPVFGKKTKLRGLQDFSRSHSTTIGRGAKVNIGIGFLLAVGGLDNSDTQIQTDVYFKDVNGDGLVDVVSGSKVLFNHLAVGSDGERIPTFTSDSRDTPSPIFSGGVIDPSFATVDPKEQEQLLSNSPMLDAVRVWEAPRSGVISIQSKVRLVSPSGDYDQEAYAQADGVRVSIQKGSKELWHKQIVKGDNRWYSYRRRGLLHVQKGERIYFRLQAGDTELSNGAFDKVDWDPSITYEPTGQSSAEMPDGKSRNRYYSHEGSVYSCYTPVHIPREAEKLYIGGFLNKPITSDVLILKAYGVADGTSSNSPSEELLWSRTIAGEESLTGNISVEIVRPKNVDNIRFELGSTSNLCWEQIRWTPWVRFDAPREQNEESPIAEEMPSVLYSASVYLDRAGTYTFEPSNYRRDFCFSGDCTFELSVRTLQTELGSLDYCYPNKNVALPTGNKQIHSKDDYPSHILTVQVDKPGRIWVDLLFNFFGQYPLSLKDFDDFSVVVCGPGENRPVEHIRYLLPNQLTKPQRGSVAYKGYPSVISESVPVRLETPGTYLFYPDGLNLIIQSDQNVFYSLTIKDRSATLGKTRLIQQGNRKPVSPAKTPQEEESTSPDHNFGESASSSYGDNIFISRYPDPIEVKIDAPKTIWVEAFMEAIPGHPTLSKIDEMKIKMVSPDQSETYIRPGIYAYAQNQGLGDMYRGWGAFAYNASVERRYARPIDERMLSLPTRPEDIKDLTKVSFFPLSVSPTSSERWTGPIPELYIDRGTMQASRMGVQDVVLTNPFADFKSGERFYGAWGIPLKSITHSNVKMAGLNGGLEGTVSEASGFNEVHQDYIDLNGDGFPDIVGRKLIQYTDPLGGFSGEQADLIRPERSYNKAKSIGVGGNPIPAFTTTASRSDAQNALGNTQTSSVNAQSGTSPFHVAQYQSGSTDRSLMMFADINGDGLPDKILSGGRVCLNLGYSFSQAIRLGRNITKKGKASTFHGGVGLSLGASSVETGYGMATTKSTTLQELMDVNADGLADLVYINKNQLMVSLNLGNGFSEPMLGYKNEDLFTRISSSEALNGSYTHTFSSAVKCALTLGLSVGKSLCRDISTLRDVDGDGYLDIVESDNESELKVTRSTIGRTNMLKSVTNSLGGTFTLDYQHSTPTYGLPGGKWVMSSVTVDDGIRDDGPMMKTIFDYSDGRKDRHEREFLGFGKVVTKNIDTEKGDSVVYRQAVQLYDVSTYYAQGYELGVSVEDATGKKYTERRNKYDNYYITANGDNYTFTQQEKLCSDRASAFVPLRYTANKQYEGETRGITTSEVWSEYYLTGYHGELKSYKFSDQGKLGENGTGGFNYQTAIQYDSNEGKHIYGLPTNVTVTGGDGKVYHHVTATYDRKYADHITQIRQQLDNDEAVSDYTYDDYGNITKITLPANDKGQRMWYSYRYEPKMNMYVERIEDAFGYRSEASNFDYRYGMALRRMDLNHYYYETDIDNLGRVKAVRGPNELATNQPYIIAFDYHPKATFDTNGITAPAYAVTKHYDSQHPNDDLETVTFVDGFGRAVQVKKDGVITTAAKGSAPKDETVMIVSGRNIYDAFGRVAKAYYPVTEAVGSKTDFNKNFDNVSPTVMVYDVLDRAMKVTLPDNAETKTEYATDAGSNTLVTTITDALGNRQATYTKGSGKTVKSEQLSGPDGTITTSFEYDGIDRLVKVTDTEGNVTTSVYDMGDRRTEVNHPASGITTFTYDALGNVLTKQTANLKQEGKSINYEYDYGRLTAINYPDHPENNVKYHYGGIHSSFNRIGRLMLREDGSGAIEYYYGKMGEVTKTVRTLIVPNQAVATYVTQWKYDSHNRLLEMIYPDEEKVTYGYNLGGLVDHVRGYKSYGYDYVNKIGYDKFEQRTYLKYCNGAETFYSYDPQRRRLENLVVNAKAGAIMDNAYSYDAVSNVLSVKNNAPLPQSGKAGGQMSHSYTYDPLYRLSSATGTYTGADNKTASYTLAMGYDNMHRITSKKQHLSQTGVQFDGSLNAGYELSYTYGREEGKKFQLDNVRDINYRTEEVPTDSTTINNGHKYEYDANGNLVYINTSRVKRDGKEDDKASEQKFKWDEENRLLAVDENGFVSNYWYDANGERTVKTSGENEAIYVNSEFSGGNTGTARFSLYVSPYLVAGQGGKYTKHIYVGSQRIVSKLGDLASYGADPRRIPYAGNEADGLSLNYKEKYAQQLQSIKDNYKTFDIPYTGTDNNDYVNGQGFCCDDGTPEAAQARAMARASIDGNFKPNEEYEKMQFYYHPDHLGSSSYITNLDGEVSQHIEYVPFGEVFIEERNNTWNTPYLFNAKELDEETGMYYYGARYYEPRLSLWMSVDKFAEKYPATSGYNYAINNPVRYIDINGDSIRVSSENRELFNKTLKDVFGEFSSKFSYTQSDMLVFSGENKGMDKAQRKVFKRLKEVMYSKTITNIQYGKDTQITDRHGNKKTFKAESGGGAATLLASEVEDYDQNFIVVDPNKTIGETMEVTDVYYKEPIDPQNGARFKKVTYQTNQTDLTFHEIGHVVYEGKGQDKVLDFNNIVRGILQLPKRQYDETHNRKVRK